MAETENQKLKQKLLEFAQRKKRNQLLWFCVMAACCVVFAVALKRAMWRDTHEDSRTD